MANDIDFIEFIGNEYLRRKKESQSSMDLMDLFSKVGHFVNHTTGTDNELEMIDYVLHLTKELEKLRMKAIAQNEKVKTLTESIRRMSAKVTVLGDRISMLEQNLND